MTILQTTPLHEQIEHLLREEIISGQLAPGQKIDMDELATRWGISNTPVRDALRRLEQAGFVIVAPRKGMYVATLDQERFKDIYELRIALESQAVESAIMAIPEHEIDACRARYEAAQQALETSGDRSLLVATDLVLHDLILRHCGNRMLIQIMNDLGDLVRWARTIVTQQPETYEAALPEHLRILDALRARDVERAQREMRQHLRSSFERTAARWRSLS
jgi:DNA-binding GntR family transcriptional regulator